MLSIKFAINDRSLYFSYRFEQVRVSIDHFVRINLEVVDWSFVYVNECESGKYYLE